MLLQRIQRSRLCPIQFHPVASLASGALPGLARQRITCGRPVALSLALAGLLLGGRMAQTAEVHYERDIRPILASRCLACHGPDGAARESDLRLDVRESAVDGAIEPGSAEESELIARISSDDPDYRMPPPAAKKPPLTAAEVKTLRAWIEQGADYAQHWAFKPPQREPPPAVSDASWPATPIDHFVLAELDTAGLHPAPDADARTLVRRLSFDLAGLPPSSDEVARYVRDPSPAAYARLVNRLLESPAYGERMTAYWLDVVRYADTVGIHGDQEWSMSPYRDWVIRAFCNNLPYNRFVTYQLAGDLLPAASLDQQVASAFNRLHMITSEGGAQAKEYLAKYAADRVRNTSAALLGVTMGCTECHDHKFDPFTTREFYQFAALFSDLRERGVYGGSGWDPELPVPDPQQQAKLAALDDTVAEAERRLAATPPEVVAGFQQWVRQARQSLFPWQVVRPDRVEIEDSSATETLDDDSVLVAKGPLDRPRYTIGLHTELTRVTGLRLEALADERLPQGGPGQGSNGNFVLTRFALQVGDRDIPLGAVWANYSQSDYDVATLLKQGDERKGWGIQGKPGVDHQAIFQLKEPLDVSPGQQLVVTLEHSFGTRHNLGRFRLAVTGEPEPIAAAESIPEDVRDALTRTADVEPGQLGDADRAVLLDHYRGFAPELEQARQQLSQAQKQRDELRKSFRTVVVSMRGEPRTMRVLPRGNWLDDSGEIVAPGVPEFLLPLKSTGERTSRLDLARWMTDPQHPLTSRVFVNRLWKLLFGRGLVTSLDDFGTQGGLPSHPELLDWLATEFIESGWDVQHMLRLMVTSRTYRQASAVSLQLREQDPENRLLARQGRFRIDAEMVRDNALSVSGLLVQRVGGRSVRPYQPAGYYAHLNFPKRSYQADEGDNLWRRTVYTHWQRTFLHPSLRAFDAPSREECTCERPRSNTPLQSLVLLNDPIYVEAGRALAATVLANGPGDLPGRMQTLFERALQRSPSQHEQITLAFLLGKHQAKFEADPKAAEALLGVGAASRPEQLDPAELAAWTSVARVVLNLHETITRY